MADVKGTFDLDLRAAQATTAEEVVFDLNGTDTPVDLPGTGGIDDGIDPPAPWSKSGAINPNRWSVKWTINLPGDRLAGNGVVSLAEVLSANHQLCAPSNLRVQSVLGSGSPVDVPGVASVTPGADAQHFTIVLTEPAGGWNPNLTYRVTYDTCTPDRLIDEQGTVYTNEATVDVFGGESSGIIASRRTGRSPSRSARRHRPAAPTATARSAGSPSQATTSSATRASRSSTA